MDEPNRQQFEAAKRASLTHLILRAARRIRARNLEALPGLVGHEPVREAHLSLMPHIDFEGTRITDIATRLGVSKQAIAPLVDELVAWGYLEKVRDPADGRARLVCFTPRGEQGLRDGLSVLEALDRTLADAFSADEYESFVAWMGRLVDALHDPSAPDAPNPPRR
jgi:DNA-binding MarR family transcriptional regulator